MHFSSSAVTPAVLFLSVALPSAVQAQIVGQDVHHDVSPALSDLAKNATAFQSAVPREAEPIRHFPMRAGFTPAPEPDSVLQRTTSASPLAPILVNSFDGIGLGLPPLFTPQTVPPDANGAAGLTQYVQWVNFSFAVFDKTTGKITLGPTPGNALWLGFGGGCEANNNGAPIVTYDKPADRWVFTQFVVDNPAPPLLGPLLQCVAVSTTPDATGTYNRYAFQYSTFGDSAKIGVWPDAYYVTFNMLSADTKSFVGAEACAYDRGAMLNGLPATRICFQPDPSVHSLLPADLDGHTLPPPGSPNFLISLDANALNLFQFHADFATPDNSTFTGPVVVAVASFTPACLDTGSTVCVPQPGVTQQLDSLGDRVMYRLAYRNFGDHESLVVNHSVSADLLSEKTGVRWYEIQNPGGTPILTQESTFAPDAGFRWMGSIAMDAAGDIAVGYSVSGNTVFPSIAFAGRAFGDPAGTLGAETTIVSGSGAQTGGLSRWGEYSAMQVDPADDCTFWYTSEYLKTSGSFNWNTRIASFKFPGCTVPALSNSMKHIGNFTQGGTGAYIITVTNAGRSATDGTPVSVLNRFVTGLTVTAMSGTNWTCTLSQQTCTRSDALAPGSSYDPITVTVSVSANAPGVVTNEAVAFGGGDTHFSTADDPTGIIQTGSDLTVTMSHQDPVVDGQTVVYTVTVRNVGLSGTDGLLVTMDSPAFSGLVPVSVTGNGWSCVITTQYSCDRTDILASGASYPPITITARANLNNLSGKTIIPTNAGVFNIGDTNGSNNGFNDPTTILPLPADLVIGMSHSGNFSQGQLSAAYLLTVKNTGGAASSGTVTVTDAPPAGLSIVGMSGAGWNCSFPVCTRKDALGGGAGYPPIMVSVNVDSNAPVAVTNTATVAGGGDGNPANNTATDLTTINPAADLTVALSHAPAVFTVGQPATYNITVSNTGGAATAGSVLVSDSVPSGLVVTAATGAGWNCQLGTPVICGRTDALAGGSSYPPISLNVNVAGGPTVTNSVVVSGGGEFNTQNNTAGDTAGVNLPVLGIAITHTGNFAAGQSGGYTILVGNTGTAATSGAVTVTDALPDGLTAIAASGAGWNCGAPATTAVTCARTDALAVNGSYPPITLTVSVGNSATSITNTVGVTGGGDSQSHLAADTATVNIPVLAITSTHGTFTLGQPGIYTITVSNTGTLPTLGTVTVTDFLPPGFNTTTLGGGGWNCSLSLTNPPTCSRSDILHDGQSYPPLTINVTVDGPVSRNSVNVLTVFGGGDGSRRQLVDPTIVIAPSLTITSSHAGNFTANQAGVYTLSVGNSGTAATSGTVTVTDTLPSGMTASAMSGTGWVCSTQPGPNCTRSDALAPAGSYPPVTLTVTANDSGLFTNTAFVGGGRDFDQHAATDPTTVVGPQWKIAKTHPGLFTAGQQGTYTITVSNAGGPATAGTVTVQDVLPAGMTAGTVSGIGWLCSGTTSVTCTRSDPLPSPSSYPPIVLPVTVGDSLPEEINSASLIVGGHTVVANDATVISTPILNVASTHTDPLVVTPGTGLMQVYSLTVSNASTAATVGRVTVTDTLPPGITAVSIGASGWLCSGTAVVTCTRSDSLPGNSTYPLIIMVVNVGDSEPIVVNTASVTGGGQAAVRTVLDPTVVVAPELAVALSHSGSFTQGQTGTYTITVSNAGTTATTGTVTVSDTLPAGMFLGGATSGTGWLCIDRTPTATCTRSDSLAAGGSYPAITVTANAGGSGPSAVNSAGVTGGGDRRLHVANDLTLVNSPSLMITSSHTGNFTPGQPGIYNIVVSNAGTAATSGGVFFSDTLPPSLTATAVNAPGWGCSALPATSVFCSRNDALASGVSYPTISLTVAVAPESPALVNHTAGVTGGGDGNNHTANDPTIIDLPDLTITATHAGDFSAGQSGAYTLTVTNAGAVATSGGTVTVNDFIPGGLTATTAGGAGWSCSLLAGPPAQMTCTRPAGVLTQGSSYPPITLNVTAAPDAVSPLTNIADVLGIGESSFANNAAFDSTVVSGFRFVPVTPCRIADTRNPNGPFGGPFLAGNTTRGFTIPASACGIPATAQAYSLNVTVVPKGSLGFLTMFPCGQPLPLASTLNSIDGRIKAGAAILPAGTGGAVCAFPTNDTELVLDINGYFLPATDPAGLAFYPLTPCRVVDTRLPNGPLAGPALAGNAARTFPVLSSACNIPATAKAYSFNFTSVPNGSLGFLTTWPAGQPQPLVSTLNAPTGTITANAAIVPAGASGDVSVFVTNNSDLVIDVNGYFAPPAPGGLSLFPLTPCRLLDTRNPAGTPPFNGAIDLNAITAGCGVPLTSRSYVLNATVVPPASLGFLTLWPQGSAQPLVSTLNAVDGAITSNMAIVPTANGAVSAFGSNPVQLVLDITAFFAP